MCGLAGYTGQGHAAVLEQMAKVLQHRGPDAHGTWLNEHTGLAHARLSIQDLSEAGAQPMSAQGIHLAFNGEIYNAPALREQLINAGHTFRGHSDTEVILQGYLQWGKAVLTRLSGMFAMALWNESQQSMLLARDRVGIKPLFYAQHEQGLVFGSEIKAIFAHTTIKKELNAPMIDAYLALGYVPRPQTIFTGVCVLPPAHMLLWQAGEVHIEPYWQLSDDTQVLQGDESDLTDELDQRLNDAVASHLLADVDIGAFLSGGVDSSLVCAIAAKHMGIHKKDKALQTFTIGFEGGGDERGWAKQVAEHIGSEHHAHIAGLDLVEKLPLFLQHLEQPLFDNSILPTYLVSQVASEKVKVVLAGDGGDEPFLGYDWTRRALTLPRLLPNIPYAGWQWAYQTGKMGLLKRGLFDISHGANERYVRRMTTSQNFRHDLYADDYRASLTNEPIDILRDALMEHEGDTRFSHVDLDWYLPEDVLFKVDRMSMAHGLEVRVPLLDHTLLEWEMSLPLGLRFKDGRGKYLLRKVAARYLPSNILKPRKQGFTIPIGEWLRGDLGGWAESLFVSDRFAGRGVFKPEKALELLRLHQSGNYELGHRLWSLIVLEMWFREWMD
ncbi:MAG: asparagine synthase (glutamine-hydrolyzing) [Proteobacteria bacterium]|nr:MAG: asparagine synthase (glutamine-hydrolyzing) [Pseudomonadota bacterium]